MKCFAPRRLSPRQERFRNLNRVVIASIAIPLAVFSAIELGLAGAQISVTSKTTRQSKVDVVPGELLVRFRKGTTFARSKGRASVALSIPAEARTVSAVVESFPGSELVDGLRLVRLNPDDMLVAISALSARSDVVYAEPNFLRHASVTPNDARFADQWSMKDAPPGGGGISAESAWNTTTGSQNVVVGVIDTGIDTGHLDLRDNVFTNPHEIPGNNVDDDGNGFVDDVNGWDFVNNDRTVFDSAADDAHGTHVAGIIGARGNNATGVAGVNWNVQLLPLKVLGPQGGSDANLISAYHYAKALRDSGVNLRVLNNSYGGQGFSQSLYDAIKQLSDDGILFIAAAGNETLNNDAVPEYPASFDLPNVISVGASTLSGQFASSFSNRGAQTVHLAAPGEAILSTTPRGYTGPGLVAADTEADGSTYSIFSGTSMATPHVAGAAALACAANGSISFLQLRAAVLFSGDESGNFATNTITGRRLNASKTVQAALESDTTPPDQPANLRINSQTGRRIELRWNESGDDGSSGRASIDEIRFTDATSGEQFRLSLTRPSDPGTERSVFVSVPVKHATGQLSVRTFDNTGNSSVLSVSVAVAADVADPYVVSLSAPTALTAPNSGTRVGVRGDDITFDFVSLPFAFSFFGFTTTSVAVSSNGALYVPIPPDFAVPHPNVGSEDGAIATGANLDNLAMIAGMWADLRTDRNPNDDVYVVQPDRDRIIFRWQAVTFGAESPANFEIELRRDGTIQTHYGNGNQNLSPVVVGISAGDPASYVVPSHTSESAPLSLSNAQTVTFALRNPPPAPSADLASSISANPNPIISGQNITYSVRVNNLGPSPAEDLVMTDVLPSGTTFVSCVSDHIFATCSGPAVGASGTVTGSIATLQPPGGDSSIGFTIVAHVTAPAGTSLQNTITATNFRPDPNATNNSTSVTSSVVAESFFNAVRSVSAGRSHTSSLRNDGTVWNWGTGSNGQLGDGNIGIGVAAATPVQVGGLENFTAVSDGNGFVLGLKGDGTVWSWGFNGAGQLGDGTTTDRSHPVQTIGLTNVTAVSAGSFFSVALKSDGTVWVWGQSSGIGSLTNVVRTSPVQLTGISNVTAISAGNHLLMLKADKTVWGVGGNSRGELGDGTTTNRPFPVQVAGLSNASAVAAGGDEFSLALKEDGTVWAWGINFNGELGPNGGPNDFSAHPNALQVSGLPAGISSIAVGDSHCLALAPDGSVWSWGNNANAQLGQGSQISNNSIPRQIQNFTGVTGLDGGVTHSVAVKSDGSVWAWGNNTDGQLGDGSNTNRFVPTRVSGLETVSAPSFNPPGGSGQTQPLDVTITCVTPGATIHYTTNGNDPTENDAVIVSGATVHISGFVFLRARAWKPGLVTSSITFGQFDATLPSNPIDTSQFFVTQHYQDFLSRQPDSSGLSFWISNIETCGTDAHCRDVKRTDTSAAFFLSIEFQETGYLVFRVYKSAFGDLPGKPVPVSLQQFRPDLQQLGMNVIVGQGDWQTQLENNKRSYLNQFVQRAPFVSQYPVSLTAAQFVDALNTNTGGALTQAERDGLVVDLANGNKTRAEVLRAVAESSAVRDREFTRAFVLMQYFGYLGRDPNSAPDTNFDGYNFWLTKLNQFGGDFRSADMVKAFIVSGEYRHRFGN